MTFSTNQNRHLYIVGACRSTVGGSPATLTPGSLTTKKDVIVKTTKDNEIYFLYQGPGGVIKSPTIQLKNLDYVKVIAAADQQIKRKKLEVTLASGINSGAPVEGQDYILRIVFRQFYGMSDQDVYIKDAAVHIGSDISTASDFYKAMVKALNKAFAREVNATATSNPYLKFSIKYSGGSYEETSGSFDGATATGIIIEELEQEWNRGIQSAERVYFDVVPTTIWDSGEEVVWAAKDADTGMYFTDTTSTNSSNPLKNGKKIADLEWFCMGERGDQYRMKGWPNYVPTEYLADAEEYDLVELHFAFTDTGVNSYRSEKDITFACETTGTHAAAKALVQAIENAANITAKASTSASGWI